jgi:hypothetical protein
MPCVRSETRNPSTCSAAVAVDKPLVDAQQAMVGPDVDIMDLKPALLGIDKAPVMARRKLQELIAAESGAFQAQFFQERAECV